MIKHTCLLICLGTHDVQHISIVSPLPNIVRITGDFIRGSTSIGVLAIIISSDPQLNPFYRFIHCANTTSLHNEDIRVPSGDYGMSVFVIEESGLPFARTASKPITVTVESFGGKV